MTGAAVVAVALPALLAVLAAARTALADRRLAAVPARVPASGRRQAGR